MKSLDQNFRNALCSYQNSTFVATLINHKSNTLNAKIIIKINYWIH